MKRLYFLTANLDSTEGIARDLSRHGVRDWNFHVLSKDEAGLYRRHVHSANLIQKSELVRYAERGAIVGILVAVLTTLYVAKAQPFGPGLNNLVFLAIFGFVTLFGAWVGGLTGLATENQKIAAYHDEIEAGKFLILIDVKASDEEDVRHLMATSHPEARYLRSGSTFINPFKFRPQRLAA